MQYSNWKKQHIRRSTIQLLIFCLPALIYMAALNYAPMWGLQIAFKRFYISRGIWGSPWIGLQNFQRYLTSPYFIRTFSNTLLLSLMQVVIGFPVPVVLALMLNQIDNQFFRRTVQTVTYAPHFISVVVMAGMLQLFLSPSIGLVNNVIRFFGGSPIYFLARAEFFRSIYVFSGIWQNAHAGRIESRPGNVDTFRDPPANWPGQFGNVDHDLMLARWLNSNGSCHVVSPAGLLSEWRI